MRPSLSQMVRRDWPTPRASPNENRMTTRSPTQEDGSHGRALAAEVGGHLNPAWVEWLMGLPIGWTGFGALEMPSFQEWRRSLLPSYRGES